MRRVYTYVCDTYQECNTYVYTSLCVLHTDSVQTIKKGVNPIVKLSKLNLLSFITYIKL